MHVATRVDGDVIAAAFAFCADDVRKPPNCRVIEQQTLD